MRKHLEEKSLVEVNEKSIFYKIKRFFIKIFKGKSNVENEAQIQADNKTKNNFIDSIKNIENEETKLLKIQEQYDNGNIKETQLSDEQIKELIILYKKQIEELSKSNEMRKQRLLQYRKNK